MSLRVLIATILSVMPVVAAPVTTSKDRFVMLDLQAMAAPSPALKHQLLPELVEMQPGNCIPQYLKCFCEQNNFFFNKEAALERERLATCALEDIKPGTLKGYGGSATRQADYAARMECCDWNLLPRLREEGFTLLLPDLQQLRMLAMAVQVRCRGEIVDGDFDGAIRSLKTLFALGRHTSEHPTLIGGLVGLAITHVACNCLEEFIQQPNAPNMYWALATMPSPHVDLRKALSGDRMMMEVGFGTLMYAKRVWSADDIGDAKKRFTEVVRVVINSADQRKELEVWMQERLKDADYLAMARKYLSDHDFPAEKVSNYPAEQVMLLRLFTKARVHRDETLKWMVLPYWQSEAGLAEAAKKPDDLEGMVCHELGFGGHKVRMAAVRVDQRLAAFRIIEAIRLHGAAHDGKLPAKLDDINVPLPNDPVSGKPFEYKLDGLTATLKGKPSKAGDAMFEYRYELRLRK